MSMTSAYSPSSFDDMSVGAALNAPFALVAVFFRFLALIFTAFVALLTVLLAFVSFLWSWRIIVFFFVAAWAGSYLIYNEYGPIMSQVEHFRRCYLYPNWINWYGPMLGMVRDIYDYVICWTNALGAINKLLTGTVFVKIFENCKGRFDLFDWLRLIGSIVGDLIQVVMTWSFVINPFQNTLPIYKLANRTTSELIPMTGAGMICLCQDLELLMLMTSRVSSSP
jgi:hypothetical protein